MLAPVLPMTILALGLAVSPGLEQVLERWPADSLLAPLRRYELQHRHSTEAAEAAMLLGDLHVARREYRLAADAFARAAAGFDPARKDEALYREGIACLGASDPLRARAVLGEVGRESAARRGEAALGIALAWIAENQPERALKRLTQLVAKDPAEAGAAALERLASLADRLGQPGVARGARERLHREYPRSFEAQGVGPEGEAAVAPVAAERARSRP
jgi:tetratricopeptide (TPR) repeat protein